MSKSDYLENSMLDEVLGGTNYVPADNLSVALYTAEPTDAGGGTEVSAASYSRAIVANTAANWPQAAGGRKENGNDITFAKATEDWGILVAFAIFDDAATPNMLYHGLLAQSKEILVDDKFLLPAGELVISED